MKHILLYIFVCISTCVVAQGFSSSFMSNDDYGISSSSLNYSNPVVAIFPNPTTDFINIQDKEGVVSTAIIFNLLGKEVATIQVKGSCTYDMMTHQKGIYLVQLKDKQGQILQTVRLKKI